MKPDSLQLRKLYALTASSCLCAGSLMILKSLWDLFGMPAFSPLPAEKASELLSPAILLLVSALCLFLLKWSSKKSCGFPCGAGCFIGTACRRVPLSPGKKCLRCTFTGRSFPGSGLCPELSFPAPIRLLRTAPPGTFRQNRSAALLFPSDFGNCRTALRASVIFVGKPPVAEGTSSANPDCNPASVCRAGNSALQMDVLPVLFCLLLFLSETAACFQNQGMENQSPSLRKSLSVFLAPPAGNLLYLTPVFLAAVLIIGLLPAKEAPMHWDTLRKLTAAAEDKANTLIIHIGSLFPGDRIPMHFPLPATLAAGT